MRAFWLILILGCKTVDHRLDPGPLAAGEARAAGSVSAEARAWALKARVAEELGDLDEAERALGWVTRLARDEPASWVLWGQFLERQQRSSEAAEAYQQALSLHEEDGRANLYLGDLYVRGERWDEAVVHLERAIASGDAPEAFEVLARLYKRMDQTTDLTALVDRWLAQPEERVDVRLARAEAAILAGRPSAAVDELSVVLSQRDDPLIGELLVEASLRACRLGSAWRVTQQLGLQEDPSYAVAVDRLRAEVEQPSAPHGSAGDCHGPTLRERAADESPCDALPWLVRAWEAAPLLDGVVEELSGARLACETAVSSEDQ